MSYLLRNLFLLVMLFGVNSAHAAWKIACQADTDADGKGAGAVSYIPNGYSCMFSNEIQVGSCFYNGDPSLNETCMPDIPPPDNCPSIANADQLDTDADGVGDACDIAAQTITVTQAAPASAKYGSSFTVAATASSGLPVTVAGSGGCTASGNMVTMTSATTACVVNYSQAGDANYWPASTVSSTTTAAKATQTITITQPAPAGAPYGSSFTVAATLSSGLTLTIKVEQNCIMTGNTITMTAASGGCLVQYSHLGNENYEGVITLNSTAAYKASQTISVTQAAPASAVLGSAFTVAATASSGLPVAYTVTGGCSLSGDTVTIIDGAATCTVKYNLAGNSYYFAAPQVSSATAVQSKFNLNAPYKGSQLKDSSGVP